MQMESHDAHGQETTNYTSSSTTKNGDTQKVTTRSYLKRFALKDFRPVWLGSLFFVNASIFVKHFLISISIKYQNTGKKRFKFSKVTLALSDTKEKSGR